MALVTTVIFKARGCIVGVSWDDVTNVINSVRAVQNEVGQGRVVVSQATLPDLSMALQGGPNLLSVGGQYTKQDARISVTWKPA